MKKFPMLLLIATFLIITGCDALGIKERDNNSNELNSANAAVSDNEQSGANMDSTSAQQISALQLELDELVTTLNEKDTIIANLENQLNDIKVKFDENSSNAAKLQADYDNLQSQVSVNNQYRNIALIVAAVSIIINIILIYLLIKMRSKYNRAALPPAKKDEHILSKDNEKESKKNNEEIKEKTENKAEVKTPSEEKKVAEESPKSAKRGRPKADATKTTTKTTKPKKEVVDNKKEITEEK